MLTKLCQEYCELFTDVTGLVFTGFIGEYWAEPNVPSVLIGSEKPRVEAGWLIPVTLVPVIMKLEFLAVIEVGTTTSGKSDEKVLSRVPVGEICQTITLRRPGGIWLVG